MQITHFEYSSPVGILRIFEKNGKIVRIRLPGSSPLKMDEELVDAHCTALKNTSEIERTVADFFSRKLSPLEYPIDLANFQKPIWQAILSIPWGETASYGEVSLIAGIPGGARAVGQACKNNPIPLFIPCHRVVAKYGLGGFNGAPGIKEKLLALEKA